MCNNKIKIGAIFMVKCSKCGVEIKEDDKYCPNCGTANINAVKKKVKTNA